MIQRIVLGILKRVNMKLGTTKEANLTGSGNRESGYFRECSVKDFSIFDSMGASSLINITSTLLDWDRYFFVKLNHDWTNPFLDRLLPWMRNPPVWAPLYLFLLVLAIVNFGRNRWWWILLFAATPALTDLCGTYLFKHVFHRLRPCHDEALAGQIRLLLGDCSGGYSFVSNHAANHFGMACFFYITTRRFLPRCAWLGLPWAALVAYSQVYVGIHYPTDVLAGALLGTVLGLSTGYLFNKNFGIAIFEDQPIVTL